MSTQADQGFVQPGQSPTPGLENLEWTGTIGLAQRLRLLLDPSQQFGVEGEMGSQVDSHVRGSGHFLGRINDTFSGSLPFPVSVGATPWIAEAVSFSARSVHEMFSLRHLAISNTRVRPGEGVGTSF